MNLLRNVIIGGVGLHQFGRFPATSTGQLVAAATQAALDDAAMTYAEIEVAYYSHVYRQGAAPGERFLAEFGMTGIPILNIENACSSGTTAIWQAYYALATGQFDSALVVGAERVPRGPVTTLEPDDPMSQVGDDHMMVSYALRMREYMLKHGASAEAIARVAVKAHDNAIDNEYAQHQRVLTLDDVLSSRMIADPLTLFQCCPTSEGAAAVVLAAEDVFTGQAKARLLAAALRTDSYEGDAVRAAGEAAYRQAGIGPSGIDVVQVHDPATIGELMRLESLGLIPVGEAWRWTEEGRTSLTGDLPVNTDGGLQAMGHPFGATGIRMTHEIVTQLRGAAGRRQVPRNSVGVVQCSGAGGISTVLIIGQA